ncbi:MAG: heme biosynthesis protein HemY [Magnetovibrio sp.]|nr:heme biosynthesis protein HemY [Magnetovibrio sp.]
MVRIILFLIAVAALAWGVIWVTDNPGDVSLNWGGWQIETSAGVLAGGVVMLTIVAALVYRFWLFLTRAPGQIGSAYRERRSRKGYKALTKGMVAVAAGDAEESRRQVQRADGLLGEPPLTLLLKAQSAQLNGDEKAAETFFTTMLEEPEMEFLGLRGLLNQAIKRGDDVAALELARRAQALKPKSEWLAETLFDLEARAGTWVAAEDALKHMGKLTGPSKGETKHAQAIVALGQSLEAEKAGDPTKSMKLAEKAVSLDTSLTAAAKRLAKIYIHRGHTKKAQGTVEKAWGLSPHPDLVELYYTACKVDNPFDKVKAMEALTSHKPGHFEGHIALAEAALEAELWGQARTHLGAVMEAGHETRKVFSLMAALEEQEHGDANQARHWLARAAVADADSAWVCADCGYVQADWSAHCSKCNGFDTMHWTVPQGLHMLSHQHETPLLLTSKT